MDLKNCKSITFKRAAKRILNGNDEFACHSLREVKANADERALFKLLYKPDQVKDSRAQEWFANYRLRDDSLVSEFNQRLRALRACAKLLKSLGA